MNRKISPGIEKYRSFENQLTRQSSIPGSKSVKFNPLAIPGGGREAFQGECGTFGGRMGLDNL
jgi:hypothetical protein